MSTNILKMTFCVLLGSLGMSLSAAHIRVFEGHRPTQYSAYVFDTYNNRLFKGQTPYGEPLCYFDRDTKRVYAGRDKTGKILFNYVFDKNYSKLIPGSYPNGKPAMYYDKVRTPPSFRRNSPGGPILAIFYEGRVIQGSSPAGKALITFSDNYKDLPEAMMVYIASQLYLKDIGDAVPAPAPKGDTAKVTVPVYKGEPSAKDILVSYKGKKLWEGAGTDGEPDYSVKVIKGVSHVKIYKGLDQTKPAAYTYYKFVLYEGDVSGDDSLGKPLMNYSILNFYRPGEDVPNAVCCFSRNQERLFKGQSAETPGELIFSFPSNENVYINLGTKIFIIYKYFFEQAARDKSK